MTWLCAALYLSGAINTLWMIVTWQEEGSRGFHKARVGLAVVFWPLIFVVVVFSFLDEALQGSDSRKGIE
jgi:hypothetical protein